VQGENCPTPFPIKYLIVNRLADQTLDKMKKNRKNNSWAKTNISANAK